MPDMLPLADVVAVVEARYPAAWARPWDAVGLVCGDPERLVRRIHVAVDPVEEVVSEALALGADLLLTHHPLFLGGTTSVAATTPKGRVAHRLVSGGCGLLVAHTNADVASPGVSDALADVLGLHDVEPLQPDPADPLDAIAVFVPRDGAQRLVDAMAAAGAGAVGDYTRCAFLADGTGTFLPGDGARPAIGRPGRVEVVEETRVEMVVPRVRRADVVAAMRAAHPYEEVAFTVVEQASLASGRGLGRVGTPSTSMTAAGLTRHVARALPTTPWGVRAAGDPDRPIRRIAVCGGSGGDLAEPAAQAGADALVTADLKHHATSESLARSAVVLVDAGHWATEAPWTAAAARLLAHDLAAWGTTVEMTVSRLVTDPWTMHAAVADGGPTEHPEEP